MVKERMGLNAAHALFKPSRSYFWGVYEK